MILRALFPHRIERAAEDEALHHLFIDELRTAHEEILEVPELPVLRALLDDLLHCADPHAAQRAKPEAKPVPLHREVRLGRVDVGRENGNVLFLHVDDVFCNFVDLVDAVV